MNRVDRLFAILTFLQSKKFVAAEDIARKFRISVRTVYRDIKALGETGVPVSFEPNKGYFIVQGYFLPPVSFTDEEANALILMGRLAKKFGDESIRQHYETAMGKIKNVLRDSQKEKVEQLDNSTKIFSYPYSEAPATAFLSDIQKAITGKTILQISYVNYSGTKSKREVEPIGLKYYSSDWHLIGWCWQRNEYRDFKAQRILSLTDTSKPFRKKKHVSLEAYMKALNEKYFPNGLP